jgi:hypothetical protein
MIQNYQMPQIADARSNSVIALHDELVMGEYVIN